jgi:putative ABC transport system permease protein
MVMSALNIKLWRDLKLLRAQTFTTALLIMCGVSLLVSSWSAYTSLKKARDSFYENYRFADIFAEIKKAPSSIVHKLKSIPGVKYVQTRILIDGLVYVKGQEETSVGRFMSLPEKSKESLNKLFLKQGRFPELGEEVEVNVHEAFARAHKLKIHDELTVIIQGRSQKVRIVGIAISPEFVYALNPSAPMPDNLHFGIFWVLSKQLEYLAKMKDEVNSVALQIDQTLQVGAVIKKIDGLLKPYGNRGAYERKHQLSNIFVEDEIRQQKTMGMFLPSIFLLVAAFLVNIVIARLISLQRAQIATLKALGYTDHEVSSHYLKIIFVIMLVGTIPGIFLGWTIGSLLMNTYKSFFFFSKLNFNLSPQAILIGLLAGMIPCVLGGLLNLRAIFRLTPAEAMRPPIPAQFQPTFIERWGLEKYFAIRSRMIYRNLLLRPIRLLALILGLSSSIAVIIVAASWEDMLDFVITTQFNRQQRHDMSVSFQNPLPQNVIRELLKINGVLFSEGYRNVPVRIRYKQHKREIALMGRKNQNRLLKLIDKKLNQVTIPESGVILTRFFEKQWGIKTGDTILVEFLEGEFKEVELKVVGFIDDFMGLGAYMNDKSLRRVLSEGPAYNVIHLKVDPIKLSEIYTKLKTFPLISSVIIKKELLKGFQETIGGMIKVFSGVMIFFALVISVGIIYNSIRVTFSERSWEMSSLMVLGFHQWSVFNLLAPEVMIQVFLSFIPGSFLGWLLVYLSVKLVHPETLDLPVIIYRSTFAISLFFVFIVLVLSLLNIFKMTSRLKLADALKIRE